MKRFILCLLLFSCSLSIYATEVVYKIVEYNTHTQTFTLNAIGKVPQGSAVYFDNEFGATTGNRYNQIPRNKKASFILTGWKGCRIHSITFSMCSNNKMGTVGYLVQDGEEILTKQAPVDFNSPQWYGMWVSKDWGVYVDITRNLDIPAFNSDTTLITIYGGSAEGSVYWDAVTIHYDLPDNVPGVSALGWVYEKLEKKSVLSPGDVVMMYRAGDAAADFDGMETSHYLDAVGIASTTAVTEPEVERFTLSKDAGVEGFWVLTDQYGRKLGATGKQALAWNGGNTAWSITLGYDGAAITNANTKYGTLRYNAPAGSYPRFWNYTSTTLPLPYLYRRVRQLEPVVSTLLAFDSLAYTAHIGEEIKILKPKFYPTNTTDYRINWNSSNPNVAWVQNGLIRLVAPGQTRITATMNDGGAASEVLLTVTGSAPLTGDLNCDGKVNVTDLTLLVNIIMEGNNTLQIADLNNDGKIDAGDIALLVNLIL